MKNLFSIIRIGFGVICSVLLLSVLSSMGMKNIEAQYYYDGNEPQPTAIPFAVEKENDYLNITMSFSLNQFHASRFVVGPDDCIEELFINNTEIVEAKGLCNMRPGFRITFPNLQSRNTVRMRIHDTGGTGGVSIHTSWLDPMLLSVLLMFILILSWTAKELLLACGKTKETTLIPLLILVALLLRIGLSHHGGFGGDMNLNRYWAYNATELGLVQSYTQKIDPGIMLPNYPPLSMMIFSAVGHVHKSFFSHGKDLELPSFYIIKVPGILADLFVIIALFLLILPMGGKRSAFMIATVYAFHPAILHNSSIWGQTDAIFTLFMCITILCIRRERWVLTGIAYAIALMLKMQALILFPIVFIAILPYLRRWLLVTLGGIAVAIPVFIPFANQNALDIIYNIYSGSVGYYTNLSSNAYNLWVMLYTRDTGKASTDAIFYLFTYRSFGILLWAAIIATVLNKWYFAIHDDIRSKGKNGMLLLSAAIIAYAFFVFNAEMHERYLFPYMVLGLPLLLIGRKGIVLYCCASLLFILNLSSIVSFGSFDSWLLQDELENALPVIVSTLQVVTFFFTWSYINTYQKTLNYKDSLLRSFMRAMRRSST